MSGLRGNNAWWALKAQTAQGTAAKFEVADKVEKTQKGFKIPFAGGNIEPARQFGQLAETDASRDQGVTYSKTGGISGTPEAYVRDPSIGALLYGVLGTEAPTGTTPNYVHTVEPFSTLPYFTVWRMVSETLWEEYLDCIISSLNIKTTAGEPLTVAATILGRKSTRLASEETNIKETPLEKNAPYTMNESKTIKLGAGAATHAISSIDLTINNNATPQQTDNFSPQDVVVGQRQIELTFDVLFENLNLYNEFVYGGESGTVESSQIINTSATFLFEHGANNSIEIAVPAIALESFPITPNTTGAPLVATVKGIAQRNTPIMKAVVKNQIEKYH